MSEYLHGYTETEQERLIRQAELLESDLFEQIDLSKCKNLVEIGCGVGAQTQILSRRYPNMKITGIDRADEQLNKAKTVNASAIQEGRVKFLKTDAANSVFDESQFDGAYICWLLEHVSDPLSILKETRRILKPGSPVYISEVLNNTFFLEPYCGATLEYWRLFNDFQWNIKGDPFVGAKLGNLLLEAGFHNIKTTPKNLHLDDRQPEERKKTIRYWSELLLSGAPQMIQKSVVSPELVDAMKNELEAVAQAKHSVFFYTYIQARAEA